MILTLVLHCDTWSLLPRRIRFKAWLGILNQEEMDRYGIKERSK